MADGSRNDDVRDSDGSESLREKLLHGRSGVLPLSSYDEQHAEHAPLMFL